MAKVKVVSRAEARVNSTFLTTSNLSPTLKFLPSSLSFSLPYCKTSSVGTSTDQYAT
jgi:hypothetical protein